MMEQYLAQRGQAGGSNVCIPKQSSNPKHSLQQRTLSEQGSNNTMKSTINDTLGQTDGDPQISRSISLGQANAGQANAQINSTHTRVKYVPSGHSTALHQL